MYRRVWERDKDFVTFARRRYSIEDVLTQWYKLLLACGELGERAGEKMRERKEYGASGTLVRLGTVERQRVFSLTFPSKEIMVN